MAQEKTTPSTTPPTEAENPPKPVRISEAERQERLTALVLRRTKLSASEAALLREVFSEILDAHHDSVWNQIRRRGLEVQETEDLLQEAFLELYSQILELGFPDSISRKIRMLVKGKLSNYMRGRKRTPDSVCLPSSGSEKPRSEPDVDRALDLREFSQRLLPQLSPEHQEVVDKIILHGMSYIDAAFVLGLPEGTVKSRVIAAKRELIALAERFLPPSQRVSP